MLRSDKCAICFSMMNRHNLVKIHPCSHIFHAKCVIPLLQTSGSSCSICREIISGSTDLSRRRNQSSSESDRQRIIDKANAGENWAALAESFGIKYHTAYRWIREGCCFIYLSHIKII